jgi:hypothetical protein
MDHPDCPYLVCETVAYRESLDLSRAARTRVSVTWYCSHPFHGIRLDLGDVRATAEEGCARCALPQPAKAPELRARMPEHKNARAR